MPKPQGTYLQTQKIEKIRLRARQDKETVTLNQASSRRSYSRQFNLLAARNTAYIAQEIGTDPTSRGDVARKALAKVVEDLNDLSEKIEELSQLHGELREPHFDYRAVTSNVSQIGVANVVSIAMAAITLLMVLEKFFYGESSRRR